MSASIVIPTIATAILMPAYLFDRLQDEFAEMTWQTFNYISGVFALAGLASFIALQFIAAPYGRYTSEKWGPTVPAVMGWIIMEAPSLVIMSLMAFAQRATLTASQWLFGALWVMHYVNRAIVYPLRIKPGAKPMNFVTCLISIFFNLANATLNGVYLYYLASYPIGYLYSWNLYLGAVLFVGGFYTNLRADSILRNLKGASGEYKIPSGFLFEYVSCANYLGELVEWTGYAIMTASPAAALFAAWTAANLVPRARTHHQWYKGKFKNYPKQRTAIIPFLY